MKTYRCLGCKLEQTLENKNDFEHEPNCKEKAIYRVWQHININIK